MKLKGLVGPLVGILVAIIIAVAVVIPVAIDVIGYNATGTTAFGTNWSTTGSEYVETVATVANLFPLLVAVLVLVGIAGYMTLSR
jgi:hypothetical protein